MEFFGNSLYEDEKIMSINNVLKRNQQKLDLNGLQIKYKHLQDNVKSISFECLSLTDTVNKVSAEMDKLRVADAITEVFNLFKRWNKETRNRHTSVNAVRIIRRSKYIYQYDYYSFYNNHLAENNSTPIGD